MKNKPPLDVRSGKVKWFNAAKGYGFITPDVGGKDIFLHITDVINYGLVEVKEGDHLAYTVSNAAKGPKAVNLRRVA